MTSLERSIELMDTFLEPGGDADKRTATFEERSAMRTIVRAVKTSREQLKVLKMAVENTTRMVDNS
jgi:hypothetical protein